MKTLQILLLSTALTICGAVSAGAQSTTPPSPETLQVAKELVGTISANMVSDLVARATAQAWPELEAALRLRNPKIDAGTLVELRAEYERLQTAYLSEVMNEAPAIYARYFTPQEMRDIIAFYHTPAGMKALKVMPQASGDLMAFITPRLPALEQKIQLAFLNILQKHGLYAN